MLSSSSNVWWFSVLPKICSETGFSSPINNVANSFLPWPSVIILDYCDSLSFCIMCCSLFTFCTLTIFLTSLKLTFLTLGTYVDFPSFLGHFICSNFYYGSQSPLQPGFFCSHYPNPLSPSHWFFTHTKSHVLSWTAFLFQALCLCTCYFLWQECPAFFYIWTPPGSPYMRLKLFPPNCSDFL